MINIEPYKSYQKEAVLVEKISSLKSAVKSIPQKNNFPV